MLVTLVLRANDIFSSLHFTEEAVLEDFWLYVWGSVLVSTQTDLETHLLSPCWQLKTLDVKPVTGCNIHVNHCTGLLDPSQQQLFGYFPFWLAMLALFVFCIVLK